MSQAKKLMQAFAGSTDAHGQTTVGRIGRKGKAEAKSFVVREPLTEEIVQGHIDGKQGVGAIPITSQNVCKFGALDIDTYDLDLQALNRKVRSMKLPLLLCRSKSGGAHLFLFLKDWEPCSVVREYLTEMSIVLGFSGCEIFPKQDALLSERGDVGNFINMPYYDADQTMRYCMDRKGEAMDLDQFLKAVAKARVSMADLENLSLSGSEEHFVDGPPCLRILVATGNVGDFRNNTLMQMGVYAKLKYPDNWQKTIEKYNQKFMSPPLEAKEVATVIAQHEKKEYFYTCGIEPFNSVCDKELCLTKRYGVGDDTSEDQAKIGGLTVILSEPRLYIMTVNGKQVELSIDQLHSQPQWQKACLEQISFMPAQMKPSRWTTMINAQMKQATFVEVPKELTMRGMFEELMKAYCLGHTRAQSAAELETGKPWVDDGLVKFKLEGLVTYLQNKGFNAYSRAKLREELIQMNGGQPCNGKESYKREDGNYAQARVWWVPEFPNEEIKLPVKEVSDEIPF